MVNGTVKRSAGLQQTAQGLAGRTWSSGLLACVVGIAPVAETKAALSFELGSLLRDSRDTSQSRFAFRSVFVPPQYARQAQTPLPLSWWGQGSDSPIAIAIGAAEGTRKPDGGRTAAYYWHTDPGNAADNFGSFSFQHFRPQEREVVAQQKTTDDKRWVSARRALPEIADQRQMRRLRRFHDQLLAQARAQNLKLTELELLNGLDLANQSELAALDSWGYIDRLAQARQLYRNPDEQIRQARTWSYWHPTENRWAAPGLGNTQASILRDQTRRANAVKQVWEREKARPSTLAALDPDAIAHNSVADSASETWVLSLTQSAAGSGFAKQPLRFDQQPSLADLVAETRPETPEQQADEALAAALAVEEAQTELMAQAILNTEVDLLQPPELFEAPSVDLAGTGDKTTDGAIDSVVEIAVQPPTSPTPSNPSGLIEAGLSVGLEGSLLMAGLTTGSSSEAVDRASDRTTDMVSSDERTNLATNLKGSITSWTALVAEPETTVTAAKPPLPKDPLSQATLNLSPPAETQSASTPQVATDVPPALAEPEPAPVVATAPQGSVAISVELPQPSTQSSPSSQSNPSLQASSPKPSPVALQSTSPPTPAPSTSAVSAPLAVATPMNALSERAAARAEAPAPKITLSAQVQKLVQPAAEAAIQGTDYAFQAHLDTAAALRRQAQLEAAAKEDAEAQRQAWIAQEQTMVSPKELPAAIALDSAALTPAKSTIAPASAGFTTPAYPQPPVSSTDPTTATADGPEATAEDVAESIIFFEGLAE